LRQISRAEKSVATLRILVQKIQVEHLMRFFFPMLLDVIFKKVKPFYVDAPVPDYTF
jgi:hypothetical protein